MRAILTVITFGLLILLAILGPVDRDELDEPGGWTGEVSRQNKLTLEARPAKTIYAEGE